MPSAWIAVCISVIVVFMVIGRQNNFMKYRIIEKKKGKKTEMSVEMIKDLIGQNVIINLFNESLASQGVIIAVEDNWIKVEEKKNAKTRLFDFILHETKLPDS